MVDATILVDSEDGDAAAPLKYTAWLDIINKMLINVASYPGQKNSDGSTAAPFVNPVLATDPDTLNRLVFARYLVSWIHPLLGAAQQAFKAADIAKPYTAWSPYIRSVFGVAAFALGISVNVLKDSSKELTAANALENVPSMATPLALAQINNGTLFIPVAIKLFIDLLCEPIAAYLLEVYGIES